MLLDSTTHRFHQTGLSRTIRRLPVVGVLADKWWMRRQGSIFYSTFAALSEPVLTRGSLNRVPDCPTIDNIINREPETVSAGDAFADEMWLVSRTHKFYACGYQDVYARVFSHLRSESPRILEVGIGVNDPTTPSGMNQDHVPGASLVGWASYFPGAEIHGADIDTRVLVDTSEYSTHYVDQRDRDSLAVLCEELGGPLDIVIDDGLHTPEANSRTCVALLPLLSERGVLIVEDILPRYNDMWMNLQATLHPAYTFRFFPGSTLRGEVGEGLAVFTRATND